MTHVILSTLLFLSLATPASARVELQLRFAENSVRPGGSIDLTAVARVERGWHINARHPSDAFLIPTILSLELPDGISATPVEYPQPDKQTFAFAEGKELLVYDGDVPLSTRLSVPTDFAGKRLSVAASLRYQACNDTTCAPPRTVRTETTIDVRSDIATGSGGGDWGGLRDGFGINFDSWLADRGLVLTLLLVFALGVGLNLTPCVYPLVSVTVAYFGGQANRSGGSLLALAGAYVLGITLTFSIVGVVAALSGGIFGAALQKPPVLILIATVLTLLALSSFGVYQLQPPAWLMQKAGGAAPGAVGALFMGSTMGLVAAPCVGPVVIGLLVFVGSQQSLTLGFALFFALGLGLGLPYLGLAAVAGSIQSLPRSGDWLVWVERLFGFVLLGMALFFLQPLLPAPIRSWAMPTLMVGAGLYLGFFDSSGAALPRFRSFQRLVGVAAVALAVWIAWPQSAESKVPWRPLELEAIAESARQGQPVVVDFVADWCLPCHEMEATTWADTDVLAESARFAMFKADITREDEHSATLTEHFNVLGVPTVIYLDAQGQEVKRLVGYVGPAQMLEVMRAIGE